MKRGPLLYIKWQDAVGCSSNWEYTSDLSKRIKRYWIHSVGFLLREDEHSVHIAPHMHKNEQYCGDMRIPRSAIAVMKELELNHKTNLGKRVDALDGALDELLIATFNNPCVDDTLRHDAKAIFDQSYPEDKGSA